MDELQVNSVVEYVGDPPALNGTWKIVKFDDYGRHAWCSPITANPAASGLSPVGGLYGLNLLNLKVVVKFRPNDVAEYTGTFRPLQGQWRIIRYFTAKEEAEGEICLWCVPLTATPTELAASLIDGYKCYTILERNLKKIEDRCVCSTQDLMAQGCKCGQFQREQGSRP